MAGVSDPSASNDPRDWGEATLSRDGSAWAGGRSEGGPEERFFLLVFHRDSSWRVQLPGRGEFTIGRAESADLCLPSSAVSRRHAAVTIDGGVATLRDLDSQNGTRLNGERLDGPQRLAPGDIITICHFTLGFHASAVDLAERPILELGSLRQRAAEEVERSLRYQRPLVVAAILLGAGAVDRVLVGKALARHLRLVDVPGWGQRGDLYVLMPELPGEAAPRVAARLLDPLREAVPAAKLGFATCPEDGCDADGLLEAARACASAIDAARVDPVSTTTFKTLQIGDRTVVVADPLMHRVFSIVERLARSDLPVLVGGETGTGKELVASAIHHWSARRQGRLVSLNCAAIPETLVESELFGHERGAFTGAVASKPGLLEAAGGGTVFLDEIGELSPGTQGKLLRVLDTRRVTRLGEIKEREVDLRIVAATNRNLEDEVREGRFRRDLFFRISGAMVWLPPLRERPRELPLLAQTFLNQACVRIGRSPMVLGPAALEALCGHDWPGNIRELRNVMEYVTATVTGSVIEPRHFRDRLREQTHPTAGGGTAPGPGSPGQVFDEQTEPHEITDPPAEVRFRPLEEEVRDLERSRMVAALAAAGGNQTRAAELIAVPLRTFVKKLKLYGLPQAGRHRSV
jgi:DNA-binding NtrC family response regulator